MNLQLLEDIKILFIALFGKTATQWKDQRVMFLLQLTVIL